MDELTKVCTTCKVEKPISEFDKKKRGKYGVRSQCKVCKKEYQKQYYLDNTEKVKDKNKQYKLDNPDYMKQWRLDNPEKVKDQQKQYYLDNHAKILDQGKQWRLDNPEKVKENHKQYHLNNTAKLKEKSKQWRLDNPAYYNQYQKNRYDNDHEYKILKLLRSRVRLALNGTSKSTSTMELVGCSVKNLRKHLESQFQEGMTWDNHSFEGWHIDHIRPCASFDMEDPIQQQECFHWTNLQPLWAFDNLSKGSKVVECS